MAQYTAPESIRIGTGVETVFGFNWPYLVASDIRVTVDGVPKTVILATSQSVLLNPAPANGAVVRIYRDTPAQDPAYLFNSGIPFLPKYVDENNRQLLYSLHEGLLSFSQTDADATQALNVANDAAIVSARALAATLRTVRGPDNEGNLNPMANATARAGKILGFDASGQPVATLPNTGGNSAVDLALDLANASDPGLGAGMVGFMGRMIRDALLDNRNIKMYGAVEGVDCINAILSCAADTTGTVVVPSGNFTANVSLLQSQAVAELLPRLRLDGALTLNYAAGKHTHTVPFFLKQNSAYGLRVLGAPVVPFQIQGQVSVTGGQDNWQVTLQLNTTAGFQVGDWFSCSTASGTGSPGIHRGCWQITGVNTALNQITYKHTGRMTTFPTNTITSSTSAKLPTELYFQSCDGVVVPTAVIELMDRVAITSNSDTYWLRSNVNGTEKGTHGVYVGSMTIALNGKIDNVNAAGLSGGHVSLGPWVGINGFDQQGVCVELGGTVWGDFVTSCNNKRRGWYASTAAGIRAKHITGSGNNLDGAITDIGGNMYSSSESVFMGNGGRGCTSSQAGCMVLDTMVSQYNLGDGAAALHNGILQATSAKVKFNGGAGYRGEYGGCLIIDNSDIEANATYGMDVGLHATARATGVLLTNNALFEIRVTEHGFVNAQSSTITHTGSPFTGRTGGLILHPGGIFTGPQQGSELRAIPNADGKGVRVATTSDGSDFIVGSDLTGGGTYTNTYHLRANVGFYYNVSEVVSLGRPSELFTTVYAKTGTINTSDGRLKTEVRMFTDAEVAAARELAGNVGIFQWLARVAVEGDAARLHVGMHVQTAVEILGKHGLNPLAYGMICYDAWDDEFDEEGNLTTAAGDLWSFRMDQLNMFIAVGAHHRLLRLEAALEAQ